MRGGNRADPNAPKPPGGPTHVGPEPEPPDSRRRDRTGVQQSPFDDSEAAPPESDEGGLAEEYQTGSEYPAMEGDEEEDIYGEDDPFPDEDGGYQERRPPTDEMNAVPRAPAEVTRIAPVTSIEEEDDDEENTDENATRSGPPIHIEVLSGPDQGRKKKFRGVRMVIGRGDGIDFKLSDNSVSRRHLELVLGDAGVMLRDLGSGNGTRVNDSKVNEKLLEDGDEISIGKTRFRFVDELRRREKEKEAEEAAAKEAAEKEAADAAAKAAEEEASKAAEEAAPEEGASEEGAAEDAGSEEGASEEAADDESSAASKTKAKSKKKKAANPLDATTTHMPPRRPARSARGRIEALDPKQKRILILAAAGFGLVLLILLGLALKPSPPAPPDPNIALAAQKMQDARAALREERFEDAIQLINAAEKLKPGVDQTNLILAAKKELEAQKALAEVHSLMSAGNFDEARAKLKDAPVGVVINEERQKKVAAELDEAENGYGKKKAEEALEAQDVAAAQAIIEKLPRAMAQELSPKLEAVKAEVAAREEEEAKDAKKAAAAAATRAKVKRKAYIDEAFSGVERKFAQGEWSRAALECDRVIETHSGDAEIRARGTDLKKWIPLFGKYLDEGTRKFKGGAVEASAKPLQKAKELYALIGFDSSLGQIIDEELSSAALAAGKGQLARNDLGSAYRSFKLALQLNPSETRAQQGIDTIGEKASDLYLRAYMIRDRDPKEAAQMFRQVMDALPPTNDTYGKAKTQLANLGMSQ